MWRARRHAWTEADIGATAILINLLGSAALLLWGLRMVRTGVLRAWGGELRRHLGQNLGNRFSAFAAGLGVTLLLQSSTATALMAASFAGRGLLRAGTALAIMLGADVGTSLVAQLYSFRIGWLPSVLILAGVVVFLASKSTRLHDLGRTGVGLGLILLALRLMAEAAAPMRDSALVAEVLASLSGEPIIAVLIGALLAVLSSSSLAVVLLTVSFVAGGVVSLPLALALVLGANLGGAVPPLLATGGADPVARRIPLGNALFRTGGVLLALPFLPLLSDLFLAFEHSPWRRVADFHTGFNIAMALVFIGLVGPVARLCARLLPERPEAEAVGEPRYLDDAARESPSVAIANAARETLRMGDILQRMLRQSLEVFQSDDRNLLREVEKLDDQVDRLHEAIKHYLTELDRESFDEEDSRRAIDVMSFTTNLEHVGDIIDKNLMELAAKKIRHRLRFSEEGMAEIATMYRRLQDNLELALNVFISGEARMARKLIEEKVVFRDLERSASENHFARLRSGKVESIETSSVHLDVIRDLKRINSHLTSAAYPILEAAGEIAKTRLKQQA